MGNILLIGAGGTGMSGVAGLLHDLGYTNLICIDGFQSELTDKLEKKGLKVIIGHGKYEPKLDDIVIYSEAVADSPEVTRAKTLAQENKKTMLILNYFQFLGEISKYFITIGFAGTNGKSSTTAMAITAAKDTIPDVGIGILGALVPQLNNQSYYLNPHHTEEIKNIFNFICTGKNQPKKIKELYFFVEACEYKRHFLHLDLDYTIITSLELDHTDYYQNMNDYLDAFISLINKTKQKIFLPGSPLVKGDLGGLLTVTKLKKDKIINVPIEKIHFTHIRGAHNDINGSLVKALGEALGYRLNVEGFQGLRRRMELLSKNPNGAMIYSDYGHMASSIIGGYEALKERYLYPAGNCGADHKLRIIFQPHQINRILLGRNDFIQAIKPYDKALIYDIYAARENIENKQKLGKKFADECGCTYTENTEEVKKFLNQADNKTIVIVFSAGDIDYKLRTQYIGF